MSDAEPPLTADERLTVVALYLGLTSKDVLHPARHGDGEENQQVGQSHILVSHALSHSPSHGESA